MNRHWRVRLAGRSLAEKILWLNMVVALAIAGILVVLKIGSAYWLERTDLAAQAEVAARLVGEIAAAAVVADDREAARRLLGTLHNSPNVHHAGLYDRKDNLLTSFQSRDTPSNSALDSVPASDGVRFTEQYLLLKAPILHDGERAGSIVVVYGLGRIATAVLHSAFITMMVTFAGLGLILFALSRYLPGILRPLHELSHAMRTVAGNQDYRIRATVEGVDEMAALGKGFNNMLDQMEARDIRLNKELAVRQRTQLQLTHMAHHDTLTGLHNRHFFNEHLTHAVSHAERAGLRLALLFLDLDNFKNINDTLGHQAGDRTLTIFAHRLESRLRGGDIVCRLGGDEFAIVVANVSQERNACAIAEKLQIAVSEPIILDGKEIHISASIGIALSQPRDNDLESLVRNADTAMYQAKIQGKARYRLFLPAMNAKAARRMSLENALRNALERDEMRLYYQPQIEIGSGRIVAAEALLRWQSPEVGFVLPSEFIPVAEETGLIVSLGEWVLQRALRDALRWQSEGLAGVGVAVNISVRQFADPRFLSRFFAFLEGSLLQPRLLEVELTESLLLEDTLVNIGRLRQMAEQGVRLAIDDFGTGYSSMTYLKQLPMSHLKIDRSFIHNMSINWSDAAITNGVIALAHSLGMTVTAEGVERSEDMALLRQYKCDRAQGYWFGRAMPLEQLLKVYGRPAAKFKAQVIHLQERVTQAH